MSHNPFTPGYAAVPPVLAGRDEWIAGFTNTVAGEGTDFSEDVAFCGVRGSGKTVLLDHFVSLARERNWAATRIEAAKGRSLLRTVAAELPTLGAGLPGRSRRYLKDLGSQIEALSVSLGVSGVASAEVSAERKVPVAQTGDLLQRSMLTLGKAAREAGMGVALMIDEVQKGAGDDLEALGIAIQACKSEGVAPVVVWAGLPEAREILMAAITYAERIKFVRFGGLQPGATLRALREPAQNSGLTIPQDQLHSLVRLTEGHPYLIQLYGRTLWDVAADHGTVTAEDLATTRRLVLGELDYGAFGRRWAQLGDGKREYLAAVAGLGDHWVSSGSIAEALGKTASQLSTTRQRLIEDGYLEAGGRQVRIIYPGFADYVRHRAVLDEVMPSHLLDNVDALTARFEGPSLS